MSAFYNSRKDFKLIPQRDTRVYEFNGELDHNSTWDTSMGKDGCLYLSLSSELKDMGFARLYEYDYKTDTARKLMDIEETLTPHYRALRPSKFHTSISFANDGRLIATTHSTDKGLTHPSWMPFGYFGHMWEGFEGSTVVAYDFETGKTEALGVPAPHESLYGSCYDAAHNAFWSLGYMKGHLYRFDLDTHKSRDFGKVTEWGSYRLQTAADGNIYSSSKSGWLFKIDTEKQEVIDMNFRLPMHPADKNGNFGEAVLGPDGRLYVSVQNTGFIFAIDTTNDKIETFDNVLGETQRFSSLPIEGTDGIYGMDFDSKGHLWYVMDVFSDGSEWIPDALFCWDILRGGKPEFKGFVGVPGRISACVSRMYIHDDTLLIVDQNHGVAATAVFSVGISQFDDCEPMLLIDPNNQEDNMFHDGDPEQNGYNKPFLENGAVIAANPYKYEGVLKESYRIWRMLAPENIEDSKVRMLAWDGDRLLGICGDKEEYVFVTENGSIEIKKALDDKELYKKVIELSGGAITTSDMKMPYYPGRQYEAVPVAETALSGGRKLVGTEDGILCIINGENVFSLGMVGYNGPVRSLTSAPDGKTAYGTAGDEEDLGMLFRYSDDKGLELLGMIQIQTPETDGMLESNILSVCRVSPDGKMLAIGGADRLGTVYIFNI